MADSRRCVLREETLSSKAGAGQSGRWGPCARLPVLLLLGTEPSLQLHSTLHGSGGPCQTVHHAFSSGTWQPEEGGLAPGTLLGLAQCLISVSIVPGANSTTSLTVQSLPMSSGRARIRCRSSLYPRHIAQCSTHLVLH